MKLVNLLITLIMMISLPSLASTEKCHEIELKVSSDHSSCHISEDKKEAQNEEEHCEMPCCHLSISNPDTITPLIGASVFIVRQIIIPRNLKIISIIREHFKPPILS